MYSTIDLSVIILAGGKSQRMGQDKRLLGFENKSIIEITIELAETLSQNIIISSNDHLAAFKSHLVVEDIIPGQGPMIGLASSFPYVTTDAAIILSCDMPLITIKEILFLYEKYTANRICVFQIDNQIQPMPGIYPKNILPVLEEKIKKQERSIVKMIKENNPNILHLPKIQHQRFLNLNYPDEYANFLKNKGS